MHRLEWRLVCRLVGALAIVGGLSGSAAAQTSRELFDQGVQALNAGKPNEAVQAFDASYRKEPTPVALYNLGLAYKAWGRPDKALEAFDGYIKFADPKKDKATVDAVRAEIERLKSAYGRFALKLTPTEATIMIDGALAQANNSELWVQTGQHKISISAAGFETYEQMLDVTAGRFDLEVRLREPSGPPESRAALLVDAGMTLLAASNAAGALEKFNAANAIYPTARGTAQMGYAKEALGDIGGAEMNVNAALKARKDPWIKENRRALRAALKRMKKNAATLEVSGSPDGAEVFVNSYSYGILPLAPLRVAGGELTVTATKEGYSPYQETFDLPARGRRALNISMSEAPKPVVVPLPVAEPVPALVAPPPEEPPPPAPKPAEPPPSTNQSDIEAMAEARRDAANEPPHDDATGFELALNVGYQPWIGGPKPAGNSGLIDAQLLLGARLLWPLSFGIQLIQGGFDTGTEGAKVVAAINPGLYVRGHIQRYKEALTFDAWAGAGIQPFAMQLMVLEPKALDLSQIDPNSLDEEGINELVRQMGKQAAGIDVVQTIQSINVPLELGGTFYITKGFGIDLAMAITFWLPQQACTHDKVTDEDGNDVDQRLCFDSGLKSQTSFFIGGGLSFLP